MKNIVNDYKILLSKFQTEEGEEYLAEFREFNFCCGGGKTIEEAIDDARSNLGIYIEELEDMGKPIPKPINDDFEYSGKFTVRISKSLHKKIAMAAEQEGVSLNSYICEAIAEKVGAATANDFLKKFEKTLMCFNSVIEKTSSYINILNVINDFNRRTVRSFEFFKNENKNVMSLTGGLFNNVAIN